MTRAQLITRITSNLSDSNSIFWTAADKNYAIQDAYSDVVGSTKCIIKSVTINITANKVYYNLLTLLSDYVGCIAIFNSNTNKWLFDDCTVRDFDRLRPDWEVWSGEPAFWTPISPQLIAIAPNKATSAGTFTVHYWAMAPTLSSDSDSFLLTDELVVDTIEMCATGDLQEQSEEFVKASTYHQRYENALDKVIQRYHNMAKSDLILRLGGQNI